jgi:hypothetical protein
VVARHQVIHADPQGLAVAHQPDRDRTDVRCLERDPEPVRPALPFEPHRVEEPDTQVMELVDVDDVDPAPSWFGTVRTIGWVQAVDRHRSIVCHSTAEVNTVGNSPPCGVAPAHLFFPCGWG